ncbi:hypothetical protein BCR44DRAFT_1440242 [Catenaria anguillulae PL171]|uniref:Uncharacterized protein n=1 Tax=Catenaria anguillulae PL171 TaxID=765915 RepID=A0A1Y2HD03_9FUNG|nr:hypothetical protein BCR44DRAFT_1440242 [Catenaria anguillulae PL171]
MQASEAQLGDRISDTRTSLSGAIAKVQGQVERMGQGLAVAISDLDGRCRRVEVGLVKVQDRVAGLDLMWSGATRGGGGGGNKESGQVDVVDPVLAELDRTKMSGSVPGSFKIGPGLVSQVDFQAMGSASSQPNSNLAQSEPMTIGKRSEPASVGVAMGGAAQRKPPPAAGPQESIPIGPTIVQELLERAMANPEPAVASVDEKPAGSQPLAAAEPVTSNAQKALAPKPAAVPEPAIPGTLEPKTASKPSAAVSPPADKLQARQKSQPRLEQEKQAPGDDLTGKWKSGEDGKPLPGDTDSKRGQGAEKTNEPSKAGDGPGV